MWPWTAAVCSLWLVNLVWLVMLMFVGRASEETWAWWLGPCWSVWVTSASQSVLNCAVVISEIHFDTGFVTWHFLKAIFHRAIVYHDSIFAIPSVPSVLWYCWLGGRKGIRPVKNWVVGCWRGHLSGARCRLAYGPADATAAHCLLLQWNPDWFYLSGTGSPG